MRSRLTACLVAAAAIVGAGTISSNARAERSEPLTATSVNLAVLSVTPSTPAQTNEPRGLTISVLLTNTTDQSLSDVRIDVVRWTPIDNQAALDAAIAHPQPPADPTFAIPIAPTDKQATLTDLGPKSQEDVQFATDTEIPTEAGLCLCHNAIYPLYITAHVLDPTGNDMQVGATQTFLPSFKDEDHPTVAVSWVWPILDRPHRLVGDGSFFDDALASSISGGRLDRVLKVAEATAATVPMTLVIDPELIDELAVMADGPYLVNVSGKSAINGVGTAAATSWLERLRAVLATPGVRFSFTPFADPDVESLTRNALSWSTNIGRTADARVTDALGGRTPNDDISWPAGEDVSDDTLAAIVRQGATGVILNDAALPATEKEVLPAALAAVQTTAGSVSAYIPSANIERYVGPVLAVGGTGLRELPQLVAQVAIHAIQPGVVTPYVVITPPRFIDPDPNVAAKAIRDTAHAFWSKPVSLNAASETVTPSNRAQLVPPTQRVGLSAQTISAATTLTRIVPALKTMLSSTDADTLLGALPAAVQRAESTGWRTDVIAGNTFAQQLTARIDALQSGVRIVKPRGSGTYTLASSNSPLPLTVENTLTVAVTVRVQLRTANGVPGFKTDDLGPQTIAPGSKITLRIPTHVERAGHFDVLAVLLTPSSEPIGAPVELSVRSTALGLIGVVITVAAGAVLALALTIRFGRRWRNRGSRTDGPAPVVTE